MSVLSRPVPPRGRNALRLAIVGEAPGEEETARSAPFVGPSGQELERMCAAAGFDLDDAFVTNVLSARPGERSNDFALACVEKGDASSRALALGPFTEQPRLWASARLEADLDRLAGELRDAAPHCVLALGNVALRATLGAWGIGALRGATALGAPLGVCPGVKVLPTYHPAAVLREWSLRPIACADLEKALREANCAVLRYDEAELWLEPSLEDLVAFTPFMRASRRCAVDVETSCGQITCVGFAPDAARAICVPFWDRRRPDWSYWPSPREEARARAWCARWIEDAGFAKVTHNGVYDVQYLAKEGWACRGFVDDTMLAHHSLWPEMRKGLGTLGATYTDFPGWKLMAAYRADEAQKSDDD